MLEPRSIAVVGASARSGSFGEQMMKQLVVGNYAGRIHPINPRYDEVFGHRCRASLEDVAEPIDLVLLGVPNSALESQLEAAAAARARAAVIFSSCYADPEPGRPSLVDRLATIANQSGMAVCGGNCMGFLNLDRNVRACGFEMPAELPAGGITFISHSGSAFSAFAFNQRNIRFNLVISAGQELNVTAADYLHYALEQPSTSLVALFLETVRDPDCFRSALELAREREIPVVALKVGRSSYARQLVIAHSGALAGEDGAYEALFDAYGVIRVDDLEEMINTVELMAPRRRPRPGGLAAVHDSGGERALLIDAAEDVGIRFAQIGDETKRRLESVLEEGLPPVNPLDAWGTGNDFEPIFGECLRALADDPDTGALALCVDLTTQEVPETGYIRVAKEINGSTELPFAVLSNLGSAIDPGDGRSLRAAGIPVLEGTMLGLRALKNMLDYGAFKDRPTPKSAPVVSDEITAAWRRRLQSLSAPTSVEAVDLLADYGIDVVRPVDAATIDEAMAAAEAAGWPVVLKTAAPDVAHKADVRGVVLGVTDSQQLGRAYADIAGRLGPLVTVAPMVAPGVEIALGVVRDDQFGSLVVVAAGGELVEIINDRSIALPPIDEAGARRMVSSIRSAPILAGMRGRAPADVDALCHAIVNLSALAEDLGSDLDALDVNPLIVNEIGCIAVDALLVPKTTAERV